MPSREVADDLPGRRCAAAEQAWALGPGDSAGALASVLGDFEHQRQVLGRELDDLATLTTGRTPLRPAGGSTVDVRPLDGGLG